MKIIVCGGRDYCDEEQAFYFLDAAHRKKTITLVIEGGAKGADALGRKWAEARGIPVLTFKADWSLGLSAGPKRNQQMLDEGKPDGVIAFPGGAGTRDMVSRAKKRAVTVWEPCRNI